MPSTPRTDSRHPSGKQYDRNRTAGQALFVRCQARQQQLRVTGDVPLPPSAQRSSRPQSRLCQMSPSSIGTGAQGAAGSIRSIRPPSAWPEGGKLADGRFLADKAYSISGGHRRRHLSGRAGRGPAIAAGLTQERQSDEISPYVFDAAKSDSLVKLRLLSRSRRRDILAAIGRRFVGSKLSRRTEPGKGAPKDFAEAASAMLQQLSRLSSGVGTLSDTSLSVKGDALYAKAAADIPAELSAATPHDYSATAAIGVAAPAAPLPATECQPRFADILAQGKISVRHRQGIHSKGTPMPCSTT